MSISVHICELDLLAASEVPSKLAPLLAGGKEAVGLLYQPDACVIVRVNAHGFSTATGPANLEAAYEMLVFCKDWEFRWVRDGIAGRATVVAEELQPVAGEQKRVCACEKRCVSYLLWGEKLNLADGWVTLSSARIGAITVPVGEAAQRYALQAFEYAFVDEEHGNVTVALQRCAAIVPWRERAPNKSDARGQGEIHG